MSDGQQEAGAPDWVKVESMVGLPDYGVAFCVSPWPDGGWMAGVQVTDLDWVTEQAARTPPAIDPAMLNVPCGDEFPDWDIINGFALGITQRGPTAAEAVEALWEQVHRL